MNCDHRREKECVGLGEMGNAETPLLRNTVTLDACLTPSQHVLVKLPSEKMMSPC